MQEEGFYMYKNLMKFLSVKRLSEVIEIFASFYLGISGLFFYNSLYFLQFYIDRGV